MQAIARRVVLPVHFVMASVLFLAPPAVAQCPGDCDSSGSVTVDDLVTAINVALARAPLNACANTDMDSNENLDIQELVNAVMSSINGCGDGCSAANGELSSTFEAIQKQIFERHGCTSALCHGSSPGQGGLNLSPDVAYQNLFEVPSTGADIDRITPGSRERSFLYLKLAAATDPSQLPTGYELPGSPMPSGMAPLSADELEAIRLWIYNGAPETGTVMGTEELLGACLPPPEPISIDPLDPPAPDEGVQFVMPPWDLHAQSEFEGCFATYYDFTGQVPEEYQNNAGTLFRWKGFEVRQDPQSHHLLLYYPPLNFEPGGINVHDPTFGTWTCRGGETPGVECEPTDLQSCGEGVCASELKPSFACVGYGPPDPERRPAEIVGGAPQAQTNFIFADGVFQQLTMKGVLYWNTHAFNLTPEDHVMNGRVNFYFAQHQENEAVRISDFSAIFKPHNPPFTQETTCNKHVFPIGSRLFLLFSHTHKHGERFWVTDPNGVMIYENFSYSDPVMERYDPPLEFDSMVEAERTVEYCATYNNGVAPDGSPDVDLVTRASRVPPNAPAFSHCKPVACVDGKVGEACETDEDCDSSPGAGDGWCDACAITGGESTENEMFVLFGAQYIDPTVPGAEIDKIPSPED